MAGQGVPAIANGAATAADWMSAASFIGMAGLISFSGSDGSVYLMGWTGGYVLLALLLAPYLRKFGHYTVPDFIGARYYSETARVVAAICAIFISVTYVAGQMKGVGVVFSRFLEVELEIGVVIGMFIVGSFAVLGGMKGITWTQVSQYFILIVAFLIPSIAISSQLTGSSIPQIGFVASDISERLNQALLELGEKEYTQPFGKFSQLNVFCITAALMFGTAGLPHVIVRFYTVRNVRAARYSAVWAIFFIAILYTTAPALGLFARYNLIKSLHESRIQQVELTYPDGEVAMVTYAEAQQIAATKLPEKQPPKMVYVLQSSEGKTLDWATRWQRTGLLEIEDLNEDGMVSLELLERNNVRKSELAKIDADIIVLSTPEVAGLPPWVIALVAAGGLAAALSTAAGLLLVISSSLAHDLYVRFFAPHASEARARHDWADRDHFWNCGSGLLWDQSARGLSVRSWLLRSGWLRRVSFRQSFWGSSFERANRTGAVLGMITGLVFTLGYIVACTSHKVLPMFFEAPLLTQDQWWWGISPQGIGTIGMLLNFAVTLVVSYCTAPPPQEVIDLVDSVRIPKASGKAVIDDGSSCQLKIFGAADVLAPAVKLFLGQAVGSLDFVAELSAVLATNFDFDFQSAIFFVLEFDFDGCPDSECFGQVPDRASTQL